MWHLVLKLLNTCSKCCILCLFSSPQSGVSLEKNLQGHHEDRWVQKLQRRQAHPKTRGKGEGQEVSRQVAWLS